MKKSHVHDPCARPPWTYATGRPFRSPRSRRPRPPVATLASTGRDAIDAEDGASVNRADLFDVRVGISRRARPDMTTIARASAVRAPSAAAALLSLLDEPRAELRAHALRRLREVVDDEWSSVASSVSAIEALYEDETFDGREDAAMLASKVRGMREKTRDDARSGMGSRARDKRARARQRSGDRRAGRDGG